jgi:midasin
LADDAVLERLNSVLEPERALLLAEKTDNDAETVVADQRFRLLATMNPGGDFGKKELSPAMRNRFTEIWVPTACERSDLLRIIDARLMQSSGEQHRRREGLSAVSAAVLDFVAQFALLAPRRRVSLRELLAWAHFCGVAVQRGLSPSQAFVHGYEIFEDC